MFKKIGLPLLLVVFLFLPCLGSAQEKSWYFTDWNTDITINADSSLLVRETATYDFTGNFHWVQRDIAKQGEMQVVDIKVYDADTGEQLASPEVEITPGYGVDTVKINFDLTNVQKTWIIEYKVLNAVGYFDTWDELYWNAVSDDRDVSIDQVDVKVHLPEAVDPSELSARLLVGLYGSTNEEDTWEIMPDGTFHYWGNNIQPYEDFTIVAGWPKGIVSEPDLVKISSEPDQADIYINGQRSYYQTPMQFYAGDQVQYGKNEVKVEKFGYESQSQTFRLSQGDGVQFVDFELKKTIWYQVLMIVVIVLLALYICSPLILLAVFLRRWFKKGRDPKGRGTIIPQYETYNKMSPGLVGTLIDEKADLIDITSTIIDLAVNGYIKIIEEEKKGVLSRKSEFTLEKLREADSKLLDYEKNILENIFHTAKRKKLSDLSTKFYVHLPEIRKEMYENLVSGGYFPKSPDKVRKKYNTWGVVLIIIGFPMIFIYGLGVVIFAYGILCLIFAPLMPARSPKGVEAKEWLEGFKMYLYHAERYRLKKMTPEHFEACLPFAMVFGVEKEWAGNFKDIYKTPPSWYEGSPDMMATWSVVAFTSALSTSFAPAISTTLNSRPSSSGYGGGSGFSGSSGFSGGGFSGGGFGGGGSSAG